jgi:Tfp pilus assembly protein PilX
MQALWNRLQNWREGEQGSERGMALVFTLLGLLLLSMLAASLMFVTSAGSFASMSFKSQMQASFAANTGVQAAVNWFRTYYAPNWLDTSTGIATTATAYTYTVQPPTYAGSLVTLGGSGPHFPDATNAVQNSFAALSTSPNNQITMGNTTGSYTITTAKLMAHDRYKKMDNTDVISERWEVSVTGTVAGPLGDSTVRETAVVERVFLPLFNDAIRGKCKVDLKGNVETDSYFSAAGPYNAAGNKFTGADAQASVGSNALIQASGASATINGNAYWGGASGTCTGGEEIAKDTIVKGKIIEAPGVPFPPISPSFTDTAGSSTEECKTVDPAYMRYNTLSVSSYNPNLAANHHNGCDAKKDAYLCVPARSAATSAYFFFNTLNTGGSGGVYLKRMTNPAGACDASNIAGDCTAANPCAAARVYVNMGMSLTGNNGIIGCLDPRYLSFFYTGGPASGIADSADTISYLGNSEFYGTIYAPYATVKISGTADTYGSITALNVEDGGNAKVHYDLSLQNMWGSASPFRIINQTRDVF